MDEDILLVSERPGSTECLLRLVVRAHIKGNTKVNIFIEYHFAIITVCLSKRHCIQTKTEHVFYLIQTHTLPYTVVN